MGTFNAAILPTTTGLSLGSSLQQWNANLNKVSTASLNNKVYANAGESVANAVARLLALNSNGGIVYFDQGTYPSGGATITSPNVMLCGAGMPGFNSTTNPTALVGGTIIQGQILVPTGADRFSIRDIGIDVGPTWINGSNGGVAQNGLAIYNPGQVIGAAQVQSPVIMNVAVLGFTPAAAVHCLLVENVNDAYVANVATCYNVYGLAFKGTNSTIDGVWARSHGTNAIIIKSDTYAIAGNVNLTNFNISNATVGDLYGGLYLAAIGNQLSYINVSNGTILNPTQFGMFIQGGVLTPAVSEVNITNVTIDSASELAAIGILMTGYVQFVNFSNLNVSNAAYGIHLNAPSAGIFNHVNVSNCNFAFITNNGVETFNFATVTGCSFTTVTTAIVSNSVGTAVSNNSFVGVTNNYSGTVQFGGLATIDNSSNVTFPAILQTSGGIIGSTATVTINALATPTALPNSANFNGFLRVRDNTLGGVACFIIDPNNSPGQLLGASNITGMVGAQVTYSSGWRLALTAGAVPRVLAWTIYS